MKIYRIYIILIVSICLSGCANISGIQGGEKDIVPPKMIGGMPLDKSVNFNGKTIEIEFNEFLVLKDIDKQLVISPPGKEKPEVKLKGKKVIVKFNEELLPNTTYTLFFGNAIADLNEENPIPGFEFVFSTGKYLDSATLRGSVMNSFSGLPEKDAWIFLYETTVDSALVKRKPTFVTRSKDDGSFLFGYLPQRNFMLYSLKDVNSNYLYDGQGEEVAFWDSPVSPVTNKPDTLLKITSDSYLLRLFTEIDSVQQIRSTGMPEPGKIVVTFKFPLENIEWEFINPMLKKTDYTTEINASRDTLIFWMKSDTLAKAKVRFTENRKLEDTVSFTYISSANRVTKQKNELKLTASSNLSVNFPFYENPLLEFNRPIAKVDTLCALVISEKDTVKSSLIFLDSLKRAMHLNYKFEESNAYSVIILPAKLTDIYGNTNDTLLYQVRTTKPEDYGSLKITIDADTSQFPLLIELRTDKGITIETRIITYNQELNFNYLLPGEYIIKCIFDKNKNCRWDTGVLSKKIQPEEVILYPGKLTIRANWDLEEHWQIQKK